MRLLLFVLCGLLLAGLTGCQTGGDPAPRIGVVLPLSGPYAAYGRQILDGIEFARQTVQKTRTPGDPIPELVVLDDAGDGAKALQAFRKLADQHVIAALVGFSSAEVLAVRNEAAKREIPVITPTGSHDGITRDNDFLFRATFNDSFQAKALARYARVNARCSRMAVMLNLDENAVYARDLGRQTIQDFVDMGGTDCGSAGFRESDDDFRPAVTELLRGEPDVVMVPAYPACAGKIIATLRDCGFRGLILGSDSWWGDDLLRYCGMNAAPAVFPSTIPADMSGNMAAFKKRIMAAGYGEPTDNTVLGYDALLLLIPAIDDSDSSDEIVRRLGRIRALPGACDHLYLKENGDMIRPVYINEIASPAPGSMPGFRLRRVIPANRLERIRQPEEKRKNLLWNI